MTDRLIAIDFGRYFTKIVYIQQLNQEFKVLNYVFKKIVAAADNKLEIIDFIKNFLRQNSISKGKAYLILSDPDSIFIRCLVLPAVPKEELLEVIKWQLKDEITFDVKDVLFNIQIIKEYTDEEGTKKNEIVFTLIKNEVIDKYLSLAADCDLNPVGITSVAFNYENIIRNYPQGQDKVIAILEIGHKDSVFCIYKDSHLSFIRRFTFSSEKLTQALTETLVSDKGKIVLTLEKAQELKESVGIPKNESSLLEGNIQALYVISLMRPHLEGLVRDVRYSLDYFVSTFKEEAPHILYICGGGANLKNLDWYLNRELKMNISNLPLPACVNIEAIDREKLVNDRNQLLSSIGAVLTGAGSVNLLASQLKIQKLELIEKIFLRIITFVISITFLFSLFAVRTRLEIYRKRIIDAKAYLKTIGEIGILADKVEPFESLMYRIRKNKIPVDALLKQISVITPPNIILDELILDQTSHSLVLKGILSVTQSKSDAILNKFVENLRGTSFFSKANFTPLRKEEQSQEIEIKCDLVY